MKSRIITLFGEEELVPEELKALPDTAGPAKKAAAQEEGPVAVLGNWKPEKQYYSIGEVAVLFGLRTSHIRSWTNEFELKVRTTKKGDRLYNPADIAVLKRIYHLVKERGFTLAGAKSKLRQEDWGATGIVDLRHALLKLRNQLLIIRNKLV